MSLVQWMWLIALVALVSIWVIADARRGREEEKIISDALAERPTPRPARIQIRVRGRLTWVPAPPPPPPARLVKGDRMPSDLTPLPPTVQRPKAQSKSRRGEIVTVSGIRSNGIETHPAIITRCFGNGLVNVTLLPDGAMPLPLLNVELFDDAAQASLYLRAIEPAKPTVCWPQPKNDAGSLK